MHRLNRAFTHFRLSEQLDGLHQHFGKVIQSAGRCLSKSTKVILSKFKFRPRKVTENKSHKYFIYGYCTLFEFFERRCRYPWSFRHMASFNTFCDLTIPAQNVYNKSCANDAHCLSNFSKLRHTMRHPFQEKTYTAL